MVPYGTVLKIGGVGASPACVAGGISAFKLSTNEYDAVRFPRIGHPTMVDAFAAITRTDPPVAVHVEDQKQAERLTAEVRAARPTEAIMPCRTRPPLVETMENLEIFEICLRTGARVHITHSSLVSGLALAETFHGMGV